MEYNKLVEHIESERIAKGYSFAKVAKMSNLPISTVNHFFKNTRTCGYSNILSILEVFEYKLELCKSTAEKPIRHSLTSKIKSCLIKGMKPNEVADTLKCKVDYVHYVIFLSKKKGEVIYKKETKTSILFQPHEAEIKKLIADGISLGRILEVIGIERTTSSEMLIRRYAIKIGAYKGFKESPIMKIFLEHKEEISSLLDLGVPKAKILAKIGVHKNHANYQALIF